MVGSPVAIEHGAQRRGADADVERARRDAATTRRVAGGHPASPRGRAARWSPGSRRMPRDQDARYRYRYYLTPTGGSEAELEEPSLAELARVIKAGACIEASFQTRQG